MNPSQPHDGLAWQAFLYVADEMSDDERMAFEEQLFESQEAREAVSQAVELSQAVQAATPVAAPVVHAGAERVWTRRLAWMAVGAAACLALVAITTQFRFTPKARDSQFADRSAPAEPRQERVVRKSSRALAMAWSEQLGVDLGISNDDAWPRGEADFAASASREAALVEHEDEPLEIVAAPSWMLAAVCHADLRRQDRGAIETSPEENVP
jgi:hypothetical protein